MKTLIILLITFSLTTISSCKKDYTCVCTTGGGSAYPSYHQVKAFSKSEALSECQKPDPMCSLQ